MAYSIVSEPKNSFIHRLIPTNVPTKAIGSARLTFVIAAAVIGPRSRGPQAELERSSPPACAPPHLGRVPARPASPPPSRRFLPPACAPPHPGRAPAPPASPPASRRSPPRKSAPAYRGQAQARPMPPPVLAAFPATCLRTALR